MVDEQSCYLTASTGKIKDTRLLTYHNRLEHLREYVRYVGEVRVAVVIPMIFVIIFNSLLLVMIVHSQYNYELI